MNVTNTVIDRPRYNKSMLTKKEVLKDLGIKGYSRIINLFFKENKNTNGIEGHDIITKVGCLITNKAIFEISPDKNGVKKTAYQKTVYLCDVEFPNSFSMKSIKSSMGKFLGTATITPHYAFSNSVVLLEDGNFYDLGLSMIDLTLKDNSQFGIINFSKDLDESSKDIIYGCEFNPKYYCILDARANEEMERSRSGNIEEFIDSSTKIIYNTFGNEAVDNFVNNEQQTGIYINKRTIAISEFMKNFFTKLLFTGIEEFEFKSDTSKPSISLTPTKIKTFATFNNDVNIHYLSMLTDDTIKAVEILEKELGEPFKIICGISNNFVITEVYFYNDDKTVRITKPLYKLYGEFAISSEEICNNQIDEQSELVKSDMLEQSIHTLNLLDNPHAITELIGYINNQTESLKLMIEENGERIQNIIGNSLIDQKRQELLQDNLRLEDKDA